MPQVNGKPYRTFGQGFAAEKGKMASNETGSPEDKGGQKGSVAHVKHLGGGKFKVKTEAGDTSEHASPEEMESSLREHFGLNASEGNESDDSYDDDGDEGSEALKSILG